MMVFVLCDGDLSRVSQVKQQTYDDAYMFFYLKRVEALNQKLEFLASLERAERR